jgi:TonB family protein
MKITVVVAAMFAGCAFFSETQSPDTLPQLVYRTALPAVPANWADFQPKLEVLFHLSRTGEITDARFVNPTGYDVWERKALEEMKQWRFSPARLGQDFVPVWVRVPITVRFTDTNKMLLVQLVCVDRACADSAYELLESGHQFESIVKELPDAGARTYEKNIGETDIRVYPAHVQKELVKLKENGFTKPIPVGDSFVIFKRLTIKSVSGV